MPDSKVLFVVKSSEQSWLDLGALESKGFRHCVVNSGFDALKELVANGSDMIVAETDLPDINGFQLCSLIKSNERVAALPVVLIRNDDLADDHFWVKAAYAEEVITRAEVEGGITTIHELLDRSLKKANEREWKAEKAKGLLPSDTLMSSSEIAKSYGSLVDVLLVERLINRIVRTLSGILEPRRQFLDAYYHLVGELFNGDVMGLVVSDQNNPWLSIKSNQPLSTSGYEQLLTDVLTKLQISTEPHIDNRAEINDSGQDLKDLEILTVAGERTGIGALFFGWYKKDIDPTSRAFINQLQIHMQPVFKLLLARQEIEVLHSREAYRANVDSLTGLYNLEFLVGFLQQQLLFSFRQRLPVGLAIIDVDELAGINDEYGFDMGDTILSGIANRLLAITRSSDLVARYGGDEFAVVLPNTDGSGAKTLGEKVRADIEQVSFLRGKKGPKVTVSVGCANFNMEDLNPETILRDAKLALQKAKEEGRNKVFI